MGELVDGGGERGLLQFGARHRRLAVDQKGLGKSRRLLQAGQGGAGRVAREIASLAAWRVAGPSISASGSLPPSAWATSSARVQPATAPGTVRAASGRAGDRLETGRAIELGRARRAGDAGRLRRARVPTLADQPEAVRRADSCADRPPRPRRPWDHRLDGIAALGQDRAAGLDRRRVGCGDDAAPMSGGVKVHQVIPCKDLL